MSEWTQKNVYPFAVLELNLNLHSKPLLQEDEDFLILGKLNNEKEFTHDEALKTKLSELDLNNVIEMNNKMGNIPKVKNYVTNKIEIVGDPESDGIKSLILLDGRSGHNHYRFFYVIQVGIQTRCLIYFYYPKNVPALSNINTFIDYRIKDFKTILGNKQIEIAKLQSEISELQGKIELIKEFYPNISSGGSKKSKKNTRRKRKAKKTRKAKRTNKK